MALVFSGTATLSFAPSNSIPKLSAAKSLSNHRCANLIASFRVLDAESAFVAKILRKLKPYGLSTVLFFQQKKPLIVSLSHFVARASFGDGSVYSSDTEDDDDNHISNDLPPPPESDTQRDSIEIEIEITGKKSRRIRSKVGIQASLQTVWDILTDYERLADFIPGLAVSKLLEKRDNFVRLYQQFHFIAATACASLACMYYNMLHELKPKYYQIGQQNLAFGLKFNAKGTIDCVEKDLEILPFGQKRDIDFKMVEGDFQFFEGTWSVEQEVRSSAGESRSESADGLESQTTLVYMVHVKPKAWLPVSLVEGRLCNEIKTNLSCIRKEAEKAHQNAISVVIED